MSFIGDVIQSTVAVIKGMTRTLSEIPREKWTVQYPDVPITVQPRYRGQHLLHVDENGKEHSNVRILSSKLLKSREQMNEKAEKQEKKTSILGAIKDYQKNDNS